MCTCTGMPGHVLPSSEQTQQRKARSSPARIVRLLPCFTLCSNGGDLRIALVVPATVRSGGHGFAGRARGWNIAITIDLGFPSRSLGREAVTRASSLCSTNCRSEIACDYSP